MEFLSPQNLWSEYDRKALPLNPTVITRAEKDGAACERLYFSGERTASGVTRIFAKLWLPAEKNPPVVIMMHDLDVDIDKFDASELLASGYAVLMLDYAGERDGKERFTLYPKELGFAEYFTHPDTLTMTPQNPKLSCWYVWTTVLLRAITYVESDDRLSGNIAVLGVGAGGSQVMKVTALEDLQCGVTVFSTNPPMGEEVTFKACLGNGSYAPLYRFPLISAVCSNASEEFFERVSGIYSGSSDKYYLSVGERVSRALLTHQKECIKAFLGRRLKMGLPIGVDAPEISAKESERQLYYEIKADPRLAIKKADLFVAYSVEKGELRNWHKYKTLSVGDGEFIVKVPVYDATRPVYAFATVYYEDGFTFSTQLFTKTPALMGVQAQPLVKSRLLYDSDSGIDDFVSPSGGDDIVMKSGAYGIDGVCSLSGEIATYKVGDIRFKAEEDSVLQLILYSDEPKEAEFVVCTLEKGADTEYVCRRKTDSGGNWTKLTLNAEDFKSGEGTLTSFAKAVYLCIRCDGLLVNTLLWV